MGHETYFIKKKLFVASIKLLLRLPLVVVVVVLALSMQLMLRCTQHRVPAMVRPCKPTRLFEYCACALYVRTAKIIILITIHLVRVCFVQQPLYSYM